MSIAAISFVLLALALLATLPVVLTAWFETSRSESEQAVVARAHAVRVGMATERQVATMRGYLLTADPAHRARFEAARADQTRSLAALDSIAHAFGPAAQTHLEQMRLLADSLQGEASDIFRSPGVAGNYVAIDARLRPIYQLLRTHRNALEAQIDGVRQARLDSVTRAVRTHRRISVGLGALAFLAVLVMGWLARRQWRLTRRLDTALAEEQGLRQRAESARAELERVTESRARLMRGFSHDVKNPLGAADGYLQLLDDRVLGELNDRQRHAVRRASRSIGGALHLVDDLVELARAETGRIEIARQPTDLRAVLGEAVEEFRAQAEGKGLTLHTDTPAEFPLVDTDGRRVRQVLGNLISNAVKYTAQGLVSVRLRLVAAGAVEGRSRHVALEVEDTGPGIPAEQQAQLFQEFVRLTPTGPERGAGLGLAISTRLAHALGGELTVESEPGRGSTFSLLLPLRRATDRSAA